MLPFHTPGIEELLTCHTPMAALHSCHTPPYYAALLTPALRHITLAIDDNMMMPPHYEMLRYTHSHYDEGRYAYYWHIDTMPHPFIDEYIGQPYVIVRRHADAAMLSLVTVRHAA